MQLQAFHPLVWNSEPFGRVGRASGRGGLQLHEGVTTYREAREDRLVRRFESSLRKLDVIVIDELGYLPIDQAGAESLFGFFSLCYEQVSVIVTTNLPFAQWPETFAGDDRMTGALLDRLTHRVEILSIEGDSYRLKQSRKSKSE